MKSDTENFSESSKNVFSQKRFCYSYPRPMVTVDIIVYAKKSRKVLFIERKNEPFKGFWAFPGGFMEMGERIKESAVRELGEETGLLLNNLVFFKFYDAPERDPRGRTVSFVFYVFVDRCLEVKGKTDAVRADWADIEKAGKLAFDHSEILNDFESFLKFSKDT